MTAAWDDASQTSVEPTKKAFHESPESRRHKGRSLRKNCPRSAHRECGVSDIGRDSMGLMEASNRDRLEHLLPVRFTRMAESSFSFFRGTSVLQAADLRRCPSSGVIVQCCGDCHLLNFGEFATPERSLVFDINDFDETFPAPFEWDVKRLAVSFVLATRWLKFSKADANAAVQLMVSTYRSQMAKYAKMSVLDTWYAKVTVHQLMKESQEDEKTRSILKKNLRKAEQSTAKHVFEKLTTMIDGRLRIAAQPPLIFHSDDYEHLMQNAIQPFLEGYRNSLMQDRKVLFDRYRIVDAAYKVVGVGSVGTRCFIILLLDTQDKPLFLQIKEARASVLDPERDGSAVLHNGQRIVEGQRLIQCASDIFLGWSRGLEGREFYVRQLRDMKVAPDLTNYTPKLLSGYGRLCGRVLARAHAKAGDAVLISGYMGSSEKFDTAIIDYAFAYAEQVEKDYERFREAIRDGRFPIETIAGETEQAIR